MPYRTSLISRFESSISQVDELLAIHHYLHSVPVTQVTDNLLRAALTMLVSAIDTSVHELIINAIMFELREDKSVFQIDKVKIGVFVGHYIVIKTHVSSRTCRNDSPTAI